MFLGVLGEFFSSVAGIYWKRALGMNVSLSSLGFMFFGWTIPLFVSLGLCFYKDISVFPINGLWFYAGLTLLVVVVSLAREPLRQYTMKREKISVMLPYSKLNTVLSIICSFYLFGDVSVISFVIALLIVGIITISSVDFRAIKIPKTLGIFLIHEVFLTVGILGTGYLLSRMDFLDFYVLLTNITLTILIIFMIVTKEYKIILKQCKSFYNARIGAAILGTAGYFISLYVISQLGIIISILISFLGVVFSLLSSFLILGDKPSYKNIIMSAGITLMVGIAFYFK